MFQRPLRRREQMWIRDIFCHEKIANVWFGANAAGKTAANQNLE